MTAHNRHVLKQCSVWSCVLKTERHKLDTDLPDPFIGALVLESGCAPWCRDSCLRK